MKSQLLVWQRLFVSAIAVASFSCNGKGPQQQVGITREALASSPSPPGGLQVAQVPQFVAVTFDDNFNAEGMDWATGFFRPLHNNAGSGNPGTFDGTPVRTTFPSNSVYLGGMQASWQTAVDDGHEIANHTVNHGDGIAYSIDQWNQEITNCTSALAGGLSSQGHPISLTGFRSPYLHYDDNLFTVLVNNGFTYDTSIMGCWADAENGKNCAWPYTLNSGSPDADTIFSKWQGRNVVPVSAHAGLWEMPVAVVFVPDDSLAGQYGFPAGLRQRVQNLLGSANNPNFFEQSTGKMVGMDITMLLDGRMTRTEALATLKYTLDLRLAGNRAPMVIVAHTHVYASNWDGNAPGVPNTNDRRSIIQDFVNYALSKPEVRVRPIADVVAWMKSPVPFGSCTPTTCAALGKSCGSVGDGCGGTLSCGTCPAGKICSSSNVCQTCTPTTCAAQGKTCGSIADGCGNTLSCGTCPAGQTCSSSNVCQTASACAPTVASYQQGKCNATAVYSGKLYKCISQAANVNGEPVGCGTAGVYCSSIAPDNSAWGSTAWQFVQSCDTSCTPTTCAALGKNCGSVGDGCGGTLSCGTCGAGQTCTGNVCQSSCTPTTCAALGKNCGSVGDGCGGTLSCGTCGAGQTCTGNVCQASCTPTTCAALGKNCGSVGDGCGGTLSCGTCGAGQTCTGNVCQGASGCSPTIASYSLGKCNATAVYAGKLYKCISQAAGVNGEAAGCGTPGAYCSSIPPDNAAWGSTAWQFVQSCN